MTDVVDFTPKDAEKDPDVVLKRAVGGYKQVIVMGYDKDGKFDARASLDLTLSDILWLLEHLKFRLLYGDYRK